MGTLISFGLSGRRLANKITERCQTQFLQWTPFLIEIGFLNEHNVEYATTAFRQNSALPGESHNGGA
jgi:hypothetical protein